MNKRPDQPLGKLNSGLLANTSLLWKAVDTALDGIMIFNKDYEIIYLNPTAEDWFSTFDSNRDPKLWGGFQSIQTMEGEKLPEQDLPLFRVLAGETFENYRIMLNHEGKIVYLSCNGVPFIEDDAIQGGVVTFRDVTAVILHEKTLEKQKTFFQHILDMLPALVHVKDLEGNTIFSNSGIHDINVDLENRKSYEGPHKANDLQIIKTKKTAEFLEKHIIGGHDRLFRVTRFPMFDESGEIRFLGGISVDITEDVRIKEAHEEMKLKSFTASKLASIGSLAGEIGHEINNPLSVIKSITYILKDLIQDKEFDPEYFTDKVNDIDLTVDRMVGIVQSLKSLSRNSETSHKERFSISELLKQVLILSAFKINSRSIKLDVVHRDSSLEGLTFYGDRIQISEVLLNLITNACDAIDGMASAQITITTECRDEKWIIKVTDNGPGVPAEIQGKIFEPFYTTKEVGKGTGLGLSIAKKIMRAHEGNLVLEKGLPTTFTMTLPLKSDEGRGILI